MLRLALAFALLTSQAPAAEVVVQATRHGDALQIEASSELGVDARRAWQVLTDYDHLSEFIPGIHASRVVARDGNALVIEQKGEARLLWFSYAMEVRLAVQEFPYERITARAVAGNFKEMTGAYYLDVEKRHVRLRYSGRMTPDFYVPPVIGTYVLRWNVERQFSALVDEIVRRQQTLKAAPPPG